MALVLERENSVGPETQEWAEELYQEYLRHLSKGFSETLKEWEETDERIIG